MFAKAIRHCTLRGICSSSGRWLHCLLQEGCTLCAGVLLQHVCKSMHCAYLTPSRFVTCSPAKKMFRFKTGDADTPTAGARVDSPYSLSPVGRDSLLGSPLLSPKRTPRRIQRSPFKARKLLVNTLSESSNAGRLHWRRDAGCCMDVELVAISYGAT